MQQLFPPAPDHILGDEHRDHVAWALPSDAGDIVQHRPGDLAVGRGEFDQIDADPPFLPCLAQPTGLGRIDGDGEPDQGVGPGGLGIRQGPQRRFVDLADEHHRVHPGRQRRRPGLGRQLMGHPVVVPADRPHHHEDHRHGHTDEPRATRELRGQNHDQNDRGHAGTDEVDRL